MSLKVGPSRKWRDVRHESEVRRSANSGLIVTVGGTAVRRDVIIAAAAKYRFAGHLPISLLRQRWLV